VRRLQGDELKNAEQELAAAGKSYRENLEKLRAMQPDLSDFIEVKPLSPEDIKKMLPEGVGLLAYYVTKENVIGWVVTREGITARKLPMTRKQLKQKITQLRELLQNFSPVHRELRELYKDLVSSFEAELKDIRQLGILPHDVLNYLPFVALRPDRDNYWTDFVRIFVSPSASVLGRLLRRYDERMGPAGGLLIMGNPALGDPNLDLPFAEKEALAVGFEQVGSEVQLGKQATETAFRQKARLSEYIHLACHGTFDPQSPLKSALKLASTEDSDGALTALEVFSLPLSARLVTLSACQTGLGKLNRGDEIIGFNRAFLAAGAGSILSSLWRVSDVATAVMMKRFYRFLKTNPTIDALQKAQQVVRRYFPHPAYWSGFVLVGIWL
jgi:CHAT domain-containing protein